MNKCEWTCHGDDIDDSSDDFTTGAKVRCFREQGKKFREEDGERKLRELGKWVLGENSENKIKCEK